MGHTAYREFEASYAQGDEALGTTYICDVGKGSRPKDDENTVAGENLATVIAHLEAVRDNSKVKQQSYPQQPFHDLTRAIPRLLRVYESEQSCYTRRVEQQEGPPTQTFKF